jgi:hypothetical protein
MQQPEHALPAITAGGKEPTDFAFHVDLKAAPTARRAPLVNSPNAQNVIKTTQSSFTIFPQPKNNTFASITEEC